MSDMKFEIRTGVTAKKISGEMVVLDVNNGIYFGLNTVGSRIWELIEEGKSKNAICETILKEYEVEPEIAERDVDQLINELSSRELIEVMGT